MDYGAAGGLGSDFDRFDRDGSVSSRPCSISWRIASDTLGIGRCLARHSSTMASCSGVNPMIFLIGWVSGLPPLLRFGFAILSNCLVCIDPCIFHICYMVGLKARQEIAMTKPDPKKQWNNYGCSHSADVENIVLIRGLIEDSDSKFKDELVAWFDDRMDVLMSALWGVVP